MCVSAEALYESSVQRTHSSKYIDRDSTSLILKPVILHSVVIF